MASAIKVLVPEAVSASRLKKGDIISVKPHYATDWDTVAYVISKLPYIKKGSDKYTVLFKATYMRTWRG